MMENLYVKGMTVVYNKDKGTVTSNVGKPIIIGFPRADRLNYEKGKRDHVLPYK